MPGIKDFFVKTVFKPSESLSQTREPEADKSCSFKLTVTAAGSGKERFLKTFPVTVLSSLSPFVS